MDFAREHVDERGLAGAVRADHRMQLALMQRDGDIAHGDQATEGAGQSLRGEHGGRGGAQVSHSGAPLLSVQSRWRSVDGRSSRGATIGARQCRSDPSAGTGRPAG